MSLMDIVHKNLLLIVENSQLTSWMCWWTNQSVFHISLNPTARVSTVHYCWKVTPTQFNYPLETSRRVGIFLK